jgi:hypothetical protein
MWETVDYKNEKLVSGQTYRATLWLPLSDDLDTRNKVINVVKNADAWVHKLPGPLQFGYSKFKITKVETGASAQDSKNVRLRPWPLRVEFVYTYKKPQTDSLVYGDESGFLGIDDAVEAFVVLAGLVAVVVIGVNIISRSLEKLVKPIFNPGIAVLVVLAIIVIMKGRGSGHG